MPNYKRAFIPGGTWFLTVNLLERHNNDLLIREIDLQRKVVRKASGERGIWQRHYWEHLIRDDDDYQRHVDYVHVNPVKHGYVERVQD